MSVSHETPLTNPAIPQQEMVAPLLPSPSDDEARFTAVHTVTAEELALHRGMLHENSDNTKVFGSRPTIGRDTTQFEGAIDIRSWQAGAESIVIDSKKDRDFDTLTNAYAKRLPRWARQTQETRLKAVYDAVGDVMTYDLDFVEDFAKSLPSGPNDSRKVSLGLYIGEGKGVCRHMSLAAAWLGTEQVNKGELQGVFTSEVNQRNVKGENDAHQWTRFTAVDGTVYILDPAQKFFGTLEKAHDKAGWEYFRPGEKELFLKRKLGEKMVQGGDTGPRAEYQKRKPDLELFQTTVSDAEKTASLTPTQRESLRGATERFYDVSKQLLVEGLQPFSHPQQGKFAEHLADNIAGVMNVERIYAKGKTASSKEIQEWLTCTLDTAKFMEGKLNPTADFTKTARVSGLVSDALKVLYPGV